MSTRFYLPSTGAADVGPAFDAGWTVVSNAIRRPCSTIRSNSPASTRQSGLFASQTDKVLIAQFVSAPIAAQSISGTIKGQMRVLEGAPTVGLDQIALEARVVSGDGGTVRGSLLAFGAYGGTLEFAQVLTNRKIAVAGTAILPVSAQDGDRLVFEIGAKLSGSSTYHDFYAAAGLGDDQATDLPENTTSASVLNPWLELSQTIDPLITAQTSPQILDALYMLSNGPAACQVAIGSSSTPGRVRKGGLELLAELGLTAIADFTCAITVVTGQLAGLANGATIVVTTPAGQETYIVKRSFPQTNPLLTTIICVTQ